MYPKLQLAKRLITTQNFWQKRHKSGVFYTRSNQFVYQRRQVWIIDRSQANIVKIQNSWRRTCSSLQRSMVKNPLSCKWTKKSQFWFCWSTTRVIVIITRTHQCRRDFRPIEFYCKTCLCFAVINFTQNCPAKKTFTWFSRFITYYNHCVGAKSEMMMETREFNDI